MAINHFELPAELGTVRVKDEYMEVDFALLYQQHMALRNVIARLRGGDRLHLVAEHEVDCLRGISAMLGELIATNDKE